MKYIIVPSSPFKYLRDCKASVKTVHLIHLYRKMNSDMKMGMGAEWIKEGEDDKRWE